MVWFKTYGFVLLLKHLCYFSLLIFKVVFFFFFGNLFMVHLYLCCFCKLLGFVFMCFVGFYGLYHAYATFLFCCLVLLAKYYAFSLSTLTLVP